MQTMSNADAEADADADGIRTKSNMSLSHSVGGHKNQAGFFSLEYDYYFQNTCLFSLLTLMPKLLFVARNRL